MKQTGFLYKEKLTDFLTGASPLVWPEVLPDGDWRPWKPSEEKQSSIDFDTMSCTTFSRLNTIENWINYFIANDKLTTAQLEQLNKLGFIQKGKFEASDRFTAIMSGTTPQGNYFQNVGDSCRKHGLLPEKDLPFGGKNWNEYHNPAVITQAMKDKALKILEIFDFPYEFTPTDGENLNTALKQTPLQVAIPVPQASHAVELIKMDYIFDTYTPFLYPRNVAIAYAIKAGVTIKKPTPTYKWFSAAEVAKWKLEASLWEVLDKARDLSAEPYIITSGKRTPAENTAVGGKPNSAHLRGLAADLYCIDNTKRTKILRGLLNCGTPVFIEIAKKHIHIDIDPSIHKLGDTIIEPDDE